MLALTISDVKDFMNKLLIGEVFDNFSLVEASVTTFNTFTIDGHLQQDFFDTDTVEEYKKEAVEYSLWRDVKPYCFSIIRGKRTPLNFKIVFQLSPFQAQNLLKNLEDNPQPQYVIFILTFSTKANLCYVPPAFPTPPFPWTKSPNISGTTCCADFLKEIIFRFRDYKSLLF